MITSLDIVAEMFPQYLGLRALEYLSKSIQNCISYTASGCIWNSIPHDGVVDISANLKRLDTSLCKPVQLFLLEEISI